MPPKKKKVKRVVAKIKQKVKVVQQVIVNVGGKGVAKRKKPKRVAAEGTRVEKKESKPTYVQIPLIVPSQPFQPSTVAFSSPDMINSALKTDNTTQHAKIEQIARAVRAARADERAKEERERERIRKREEDLISARERERIHIREEGLISARERERGQVNHGNILLSRRIDKQREDMRLAMMDD